MKRRLSIMKDFIIILFPTLIAVSSFAQKKMIYVSVKPIDTAKVLYFYNYLEQETAEQNLVPMVLASGSHYQKFGCLQNFYIDSLALLFDNKPQDTKTLMRENNKIMRNPLCHEKVNWALYLNYPKGKRSITDRVFMDKYISEEENTLPSWTLSSERQTIAGRKCQKATTTFYGRKWTAWYTPEIACSDGPWLLRGLPGLVVMAEDESQKFKFELTRIERRSVPIVFVSRSYIKADRKAVLKQKQTYYKNRGQFIAGSSVGAQTSGIPTTSEEVPYDPIRKVLD